VEREGHCLVPQRYLTSSGCSLGLWASNQRRTKDDLPADRKERLEALPGWVWDALASQWEAGYRYLMEFEEREGHCRVPNKFRTEDGFYLGEWVGRQRRDKSELSAEQKERLDAVPGWVWDDLANRWETGLHYLTEFSEREGHCNVPARFVTADEYLLGAWVSNQRSRMEVMPLARKELLEALPGWRWRNR